MQWVCPGQPLGWSGCSLKTRLGSWALIVLAVPMCLLALLLIFLGRASASPPTSSRVSPHQEAILPTAQDPLRVTVGSGTTELWFSEAPVEALAACGQPAAGQRSERVT